MSAPVTTQANSDYSGYAAASAPAESRDFTSIWTQGTAGVDAACHKIDSIARQHKGKKNPFANRKPAATEAKVNDTANGKLGQ